MSNHEEDAFIISMMLWSYSRLNSFYTCPYEWHKIYIEGVKQAESAQAQFGTFFHSILEKYAKGELDIFELCQYYEDHFDEEITCDFPPNKYVDMRQKYYEEGLDYLANINLNLDDYEVLGVERKVSFEIGGYNMVGFIDLLLRDKQSGEIIILDHKSAKIGVLKKGGIAKKDKAHFESFKKQLYLYAKPVLEEYGIVDKLRWNLFRDQRFIEIPFDRKEYEEALAWALDTIKRIETETEWGINEEMIDAINNEKYPPFFCVNLCGYKYECPYRNGLLEELRNKEDDLDEEML